MPNKPSDLLTNNHFYFEVPGLISPHFHKISGISKKSGEVSIVDGATNTKHKFSSQIKDFGDITLIRTPDGSVDDYSMRALVDKCLNAGFRFDGNLVKLHNGQEAFRIMFLGLRIKEVNYPDFDTSAEERMDISYVCSVSEWVEI